MPAQQSLPPGRQNWPRIWQRQVPMVAPIARSQSIAPQQSELLMHDSPVRRQTHAPPWQRLVPQHSLLFMHDTGVDIVVSAGVRQQRRPAGRRLQR